MPSIVLAVLLYCQSAPEPADVWITQATIFDGTGKPGIQGNVHIRKDKIVAVGPAQTLPVPQGARTIDATGLYLTPGFIDLHTHCDPGLPTKNGKTNKNYITQGCTTVITGNCGSGPVNVAQFFQTLEKQGVGTNVIHLAPHNSIRSQAMGNDNRAPSADEQKKMEELTEQAMKDGAWGLATGLIYTPGTYSQTKEIAGLAKVAGKHQGIYASHIRDEGSGLLTAIEEALSIGREGNLPVHISHIKASGRAAWGTSANAIGLIESARKKGQTVTADQYPYIASSTSLSATVVPSRYRDGGNKAYKDRFDDPTVGPKLREAISKAVTGRDNGERIRIARFAPKPHWQGKNLKEIAEAEKKEITDIVIEIEKGGGAQVVNFGMSEEDVRLYMKQPWVATASDGGVQTPGSTVPHPRSYGTFPRKIGRYAIEDQIIPVEQAIHSATGLPASILRLKDRGIIQAGAYADVVLFDPKTFRDTATYDKPHQYAAGVQYVFVNGQAVIEKGEHKPDVLAGKCLRREENQLNKK